MTLVNVIVSSSGLTVTYSDGKQSTHPTKLSPVPDEKGNIFYYRPVARNEPKALLYAKKLGQELCKKLKQQNVKVPNAVLIDLPDGYGLYDHIKQYPLGASGKYKIRSDTYLYGNGTKFRSPAEFKDHLLWLASDKAVSCNCQYCGGQKSTTLEAAFASFSSKEPNVQKKKASTLNNDKNESSIKFVNMYRCKEIVWGDIEYILNSSQHGTLSKEIGYNQIKYWPALVHQRSKADLDSSDNKDNNYVILYVLQPLMLPGTMKLPHKAILPWLAYNPSNPTQAIEGVMHNNSHFQPLESSNHIQLLDCSNQNHSQSPESSNHIQLLESSNNMQTLESSNHIRSLESSKQNGLVNAYLKAIALAKKIALTFTPLQQYKYKLQPMYLLKIENTEEKRLLQEMESYPHYRNILLGSELLRENDYVRLKHPSRDYNDEMPIFKINTIFLNALNKIQLSGDIFVRAPSMKFNGNVPMLIKLNEENLEYTMDLSEIAGRYYILHHIIRSMPVTVQLPYEDRMLLVDEAPKQVANPTGLRKQVAKRSMLLPNKKIKVNNESSLSNELLSSHMDYNNISPKASTYTEISITVSSNHPFTNESEEGILIQ
ncbi:13146_t:CDS:2 [Cetraspora pellucida]|uniref:13146_t:CDS:1 n=1 Tax=Cetraspora pellucida TaxID=1433469 RepID=A0ACA9LW80_9GLOM|nr:13146_t:CDS:2 [Cetraspora pellucida]